MDAILIAGPTASGKSALAVRLARQYDGVVVNADSMQVYDALRVLTARPTPADTNALEHRLYGHVPAETSYSTGAWYRDAKSVFEDIRERRLIPIIVGGTGLYFKALSGGLSPMPEITGEQRMYWRRKLVEAGSASLHEELQRIDAQTAMRLDPTDGQRIVRALEVMHATGRSIRHYQAQTSDPLVDIKGSRKIVLIPPRALLHERIKRRFATMIDHGALAEVSALLARGLDPGMPIMKAIGVRELQSAIEGKLSVADAERRAAASSRQYAKRQITWFRNQLDDSWEIVREGNIFA